MTDEEIGAILINILIIEETAAEISRDENAVEDIALLAGLIADLSSSVRELVS